MNNLVLTSFVESTEKILERCYPIIKKRRIIMPYKILTEEVIDEMLENISYIKLNTYIKLQKEN